MFLVNISYLCTVICMILLKNLNSEGIMLEKRDNFHDARLGRYVRECTESNECADHEKCMNYRCFDVCSIAKCASRNERCYARNHTEICSCLPGFIRNENGLCEAPCIDDDSCGQNAECKKVGNAFKCECKSGYYPDPYTFTECMQRRSCRTRDDCYHNEICKKDQCIVKCSENICTKSHEICISTDIGEECICKEGYKFDTTKNCVRVECLNDNDCPSNKICKIINGVHKCGCPKGYVSRLLTDTHESKCRWRCADNSDCAKGFWCRGYTCVECDDAMCRKPRK